MHYGGLSMRINVEPRTVLAAQRGDPQARDLLAGCCRELFERKLAKDRIWGEEREEILSTALEVVFSALPRFEGRSRFETWAIGILLRITWKYRQSQGRLRETTVLFTDQDPEDSDRASFSERIAGNDDIERQQACNELRAALSDCLKMVKPEMREAWIQHRLQGLRHIDIAQNLGIKSETVGTRIFRVDRRMQKCLETKGFTPEQIGG